MDNDIEKIMDNDIEKYKNYINMREEALIYGFLKQLFPHEDDEKIVLEGVGIIKEKLLRKLH